MSNILDDFIIGSCIGAFIIILSMMIYFLFKLIEERDIENKRIEEEITNLIQGR